MKHFEIEIISLENIVPPVISLIPSYKFDCYNFTKEYLKEFIDELQEYYVKLAMIEIKEKLQSP